MGHLSTKAYTYAVAGAVTGGTVKRYRAALDGYQRTPRILSGRSPVHMETKRFGRTFAAPVGLAPIGAQAMYHGDGELASARRHRSTCRSV